MRFLGRNIVSGGCWVLVALLLVVSGCASSGNQVGKLQDGVSSGRRVPMRPFRRPVSTVVEVERVDWPFGLYQWPDPWVPLMVYHPSGVLFFNAKGEIYRTYAWRQDGGEERSALWVLDVQGDGMPSIVTAGEPTLILRSNADVAYVRPRGCAVMVGIDAASGRRQLRCQDGASAEEVGARPLENYVVKRHGAYGVDEGFFFDFDRDGRAEEFARQVEEGLAIVARERGEEIARVETAQPVEGMMVADLDGDGVEELVVLAGEEMVIVRGEGREVLRWPTDTRRYARVVVVEATEVVGSVLAREQVPAMVGPLAACFEDEMGLLYDKPDAVLQVVLSGDEDRPAEYSVVRGYLYDEQLGCVGRVLEKFAVTVRFRVRVNWRDALAVEVAVGKAGEALRGARRAAESGVLEGGQAVVASPEQAECAGWVVDEAGWRRVEDRAEVEGWVLAVEQGGHPAFEGAESALMAEGDALIPPVETVQVFVRCTEGFQGAGHAERLVKYTWNSALDSVEACDPEDEAAELPCYGHRLHVLFGAEAEKDASGWGWRPLAVMADHYIGYMHDRHTLFGAESRRLPDGRAGVWVTFTNRDARTGCFFGSSALMTYEEGAFVRAPGTQRQLRPCFPDLDRSLPETPQDLRCPGIHQLENIEGYKRAGYAEVYDHGRGFDFRCFRPPGSSTISVK